MGNKLVIYLVGSLFVLWGISVFMAYSRGVSDSDTKWEARIIEANTENLKQIQRIEKAVAEKQNKMISAHLAQISELEDKYEKEISAIKANHLRDTVTDIKPCRVLNTSTNKTVSPKTTTRPDLVCYTREQLLQKVKNTLGIGAECDKLAERYKTLLEVCK